MKDIDVEQSLVKTLRESDLRKLSSDIGEFTLDLFLENEVAKSIPVFGTLQSLLKIGGSIRDYIFAKKLFKFLVSLSDISCRERQKLIEKLESDDNYNQNVGEQIILLLDRMDDIHKPELVAKAFRAYLEGKIDSIQLQRINFGIDRVFSCNLPELREYYLMDTPDDMAHDVLEPMVFQNLADSGFVNLTAGLGGGVGTAKNELGTLFVEYILCDNQ